MTALDDYKKAVVKGYVFAYTDIGVGAGGMILSGHSLGVRAYFIYRKAFSGDQFLGGIQSYIALENGLFKEGKSKIK